jgi:hypothetical protein
MITAIINKASGPIRVKVEAIRTRPNGAQVADVRALRGQPFPEYSYNGGPVDVATATVPVAALSGVMQMGESIDAAALTLSGREPSAQELEAAARKARAQACADSLVEAHRICSGCDNQHLCDLFEKFRARWSAQA